MATDLVFGGCSGLYFRMCYVVLDDNKGWLWCVRK